MNKKGIDELAEVLNGQIARISDRPDDLELGTIQNDFSLKLDGFAVPIKQGDYLIAEFTADLVLPDFSIVGTGEYPVDEYGVPIPAVPIYHTAQTRWDYLQRTIQKVEIKLKPQLKSGDRVLVAWVNQYRDPVVIAKVVSS